MATRFIRILTPDARLLFTTRLVRLFAYWFLSVVLALYLAHRGVLFLDELPEFDQRSLEVLQQPLEDKIVTISRAAARPD